MGGRDGGLKTLRWSSSRCGHGRPAEPRQSHLGHRATGESLHEASQSDPGTLSAGGGDGNATNGVGSFMTPRRAAGSGFLFPFVLQKMKLKQGMLTPLPDPEVQRTWGGRGLGAACSWVTARVESRRRGRGALRGDVGDFVFLQPGSRG